ncbi:MAG: hypothetical protein C4331_12855 [Meiothermus sp.]
MSDTDFAASPRRAIHPKGELTSATAPFRIEPRRAHRQNGHGYHRSDRCHQQLGVGLHQRHDLIDPLLALGGRRCTRGRGSGFGLDGWGSLLRAFVGLGF